ncbi:hypothetical protein [Microbulbifer litoralis]|uniref:hypothetical protein n=1 Tax=Microbulbifer litoralis TaxID=2933965 RepID=UPI00202981F8|nr:hypothetical protein [Microbulbifer sp. GX H0434]
MIRRILLIIYMAFAASAFGSGGPEEVELSPDLASRLGFKIEISPEHNGTVVEVVGPPELNNGCLPARSGSFLLDKAGNEISAYITELSRRSESPKTVGYLSSRSSNIMGIFIDYFCSKERIYDSKRYTITSINGWK